MSWLVYQNLDEKTQLFVGTLLIMVMMIIMVSNIIIWICNRIKRK